MFHIMNTPNVMHTAFGLWIQILFIRTDWIFVLSLVQKIFNSIHHTIVNSRNEECNLILFPCVIIFFSYHYWAFVYSSIVAQDFLCQCCERKHTGRFLLWKIHFQMEQTPTPSPFNAHVRVSSSIHHYHYRLVCSRFSLVQVNISLHITHWVIIIR